MSVFDRELTGYRYASTNHGDTIQQIAFRELGDASRWAELVWINDLLPPYITDDPDKASGRVLLSGKQIVVPAVTAPSVAAEIDPYKVFETDCRLRSGLLESDGAGDFQIVEGRENLRQQLTHRIVTDKGALIYHPAYGCDVRRLIGVVNGPTAALLGEQYVTAALLSDFRVAEVTRSSAEVSGDRIAIDAEVRPISGRPVDIQVG